MHQTWEVSVFPYSDLCTAYINNGVCSSREEELLILRQTETEDAAFVRLDDSATFVGIEAVDLNSLFGKISSTPASIPVSRLPGYQRRYIATRRQVPIWTCRVSCDAPAPASCYPWEQASLRQSTGHGHGTLEELSSALSARLHHIFQYCSCMSRGEATLAWSDDGSSGSSAPARRSVVGVACVPHLSSEPRTFQLDRPRQVP